MNALLYQVLLGFVTLSSSILRRMIWEPEGISAVRCKGGSKFSLIEKLIYCQSLD